MSEPLTLYWQGDASSAERIALSGFQDETVLDDPPISGVFLTGEQYLIVGRTSEPSEESERGRAVLRVALTLADDDIERFALRNGDGWPEQDAYVFPAAWLNARHPGMTAVMVAELQTMFRSKQDAWREQIERESAILRGLPRGGTSE
jgi:hypothetical protein